MKFHSNFQLSIGLHLLLHMKSLVEVESGIELLGSNKIKEENRSGAITEHKLNLDELSLLYNTNINFGISENEAQARYDLYGPNALTPPKKNLSGMIFHSYKCQ